MTLTDTQSLLLAHAARHEHGSFYPLPETLTSKAGAAKSLATLMKRRFAEEREVVDAAVVSRSDGDLRFGMFVTAAGLAVIGVGDDADTGGFADSTPVGAAPSLTPCVTKAATVLALLRRAEGATLAELIAATAWLPHTTRAALTGLRKKGHVLDKGKRDGTTCYRIVEAA